MQDHVQLRLCHEACWYSNEGLLEDCTNIVARAQSLLWLWDALKAGGQRSGSQSLKDFVSIWVNGDV